MKRGWMFLLAAGLAMLLPFLALGESARVVTPGGKLNMRKAADEKAKIVADVPNNAWVEAEETGEEWSRIVYRNKTGYVKTAYLRLPSLLPGKTVYADEGTLILRRAPSPDAAIVGALNGRESVFVIRADGGWALVSLGDIQGYVETEKLSLQMETPAEEADWIREAAVIAAPCTLYASLEEDAAALAELSAGQKATVTLIAGDQCLVETERGYGFIATAQARLLGVEDSGEQTGDISAAEAVQAASAALKKANKGFAKEKLYHQVSPCPERDGLEGPLYACGFFNEQDQYVYAALVHAESKRVVFTAAYPGFAAPSPEESLLPAGEVAVTLSAEEIEVGQTVDISVQAWTTRQCRYTLLRDGQTAAETEPGEHFTAAFRAKEPGDYLLTVTVTDAKGDSASAEASFRVVGERKASEREEVYSQLDGWWSTVKYRHSNMEHSGCAVFALAHALNRLGFADESTLPDNLAKTYALCLTPQEGTNNERLITSASKDFGFKTQRQLIKDAKQLAKLLREGALFSFRVARGHIAMIGGISQDGEMVLVVDSAPSATMERIVNVSMYYQTRSGSFRAARSLDEMPGARWYIDTQDYGGLEYWMPISYPAKLGARLIQKTADEGTEK